MWEDFFFNKNYLGGLWSTVIGMQILRKPFNESSQILPSLLFLALEECRSTPSGYHLCILYLYDRQMKQILRI